MNANRDRHLTLHLFIIFLFCGTLKIHSTHGSLSLYVCEDTHEMMRIESVPRINDELVMDLLFIEKIGFVFYCSSYSVLTFVFLFLHLFRSLFIFAERAKFFIATHELYLWWIRYTCDLQIIANQQLKLYWAVWCTCWNRIYTFSQNDVQRKQ